MKSWSRVFWPCVLGFQQGLHDSLQRGRVTAHLDLVVGRGDRRRAEQTHLDRVLRIGKSLQRPLLERIQHDDRHTAARAFVQRAHHARMVGSGVVTDREDQVACVEVIQRDGSLALADGVRQADAGGLVAHVGAVGEVVRAVLAHEDLIQKGRLVGGASRSVELGHVGIRQGPQGSADPLESRLPGDRLVCVGLAVVGDRVREASFAFQIQVRPLQQ